MKQSDKIFYIVFLSAIFCNVIFMLWFRLLPFADLPNHLAEATVYKFYDNAGNLFSHYFDKGSFITPNSIHLYLFTLNVFPTVEYAARFFYILYVILLPLSVLVFVRSIGGNKWISLLSFLFIYNYNVTWGFWGFTMSIPIVLIALVIYRKAINDANLFILAVGAILSIILFFTHLLAALFLTGVLMISLLILRAEQRKMILPVILSLTPLILLIAVWYISFRLNHNDSTFAFLVDYYKHKYIGGFVQRTRVIWIDSVHLFNYGTGRIPGAVIFSLIIIPLLIVVAYKFKIFWEQLFSRNNVVLVSFVIFSVLCVLLLPPDMPEQWILYQRFGVFLMLSLIILLSMIIKEIKAFNYLIISAIGVYLVLWGQYFYEFDERNKDFNREFFNQTKNSGYLAGLIFDPTYRGRNTTHNFNNYYIVWNKKITTTCIGDYKYGILKRKTGTDVLPHYDALMDSSLTSTVHYSNASHILLTGKEPSFFRSFLSGYHLINSKGDWKLLEKNGIKQN